MKRLLLGITLLAIIFLAVLCKPIDNINEDALLQDEQAETLAIQSSK